MAGAENALLHGDELLADDVPLLLRIASRSSSAPRNSVARVFHVECRRAELVEQALDIFGFAFAHEAGIDIDPVDSLAVQAPAGTACRPPWNRRRR